MTDYTERFNHCPPEAAIARFIMATEIYRDSCDLIAQAEKVRKFRHDLDKFSIIADAIKQLGEKRDKILALVGTPIEWENPHKDAKTLIAEAMMAIIETYGGDYTELLFRIREARSLVHMRMDGLTDRQHRIFANWRSHLYR